VNPDLMFIGAMGAVIIGCWVWMLVDLRRRR